MEGDGRGGVGIGGEGKGGKGTGGEGMGWEGRGREECCGVKKILKIDPAQMIKLLLNALLLIVR